MKCSLRFFLEDSSRFFMIYQALIFTILVVANISNSNPSDEFTEQNIVISYLIDLASADLIKAKKAANELSKYAYVEINEALLYVFSKELKKPAPNLSFALHVLHSLYLRASPRNVRDIAFIRITVLNLIDIKAARDIFLKLIDVTISEAQFRNNRDLNTLSHRHAKIALAYIKHEKEVLLREVEEIAQLQTVKLSLLSDVKKGAQNLSSNDPNIEVALEKAMESAFRIPAAILDKLSEETVLSIPVLASTYKLPALEFHLQNSLTEKVSQTTQSSISKVCSPFFVYLMEAMLCN